jgi:hypothetical protein
MWVVRAAGVIAAFILALVVLWNIKPVPGMIIIGLVALIPVTIMVVNAILSALIVGRIADDDMVLVRISPLPGSTLADGYLRGIHHQLRAIREVGVLLPLGLITGVIFRINLYSAVTTGTLSLLWVITNSITALFLSAVILVLPGALFLGLEHVLVVIGVWLGLRWPRNAATLGGVAGVTVVAVLVLILAGFVSFVASSRGMDSAMLLFCGFPTLMMLVSLLFLALEVAVRRDIIRYISGGSS